MKVYCYIRNYSCIICIGIGIGMYVCMYSTDLGTMYIIISIVSESNEGLFINNNKHT